MQTIRWGLSSTGRMAEWFARDFPFVPGGEVVAVASRERSRAEDFARRVGIPRAHGSFAELLADETVDVIYISSPHSHHHDHARDALEAGKAVLCEKPLTTSPDECRALIEVAERTGGYLMEGLWTYCLPAIQQARAWVEAGRLGRILHVAADFGYPQVYHPEQREYAVELGGGALLEMGIYPVALAWLFLGRDPDRLAVSKEKAPNGVEDDLVALLEYRDPECVARLATSFRCKLPNTAYVIGEQAYLEIPHFWRARECSLFQLDERIDHFVDRRESQGFCYEAIAVQNDLHAGRRQSPWVPLATSLAIQEHLARIREMP